MKSLQSNNTTTQKKGMQEFAQHNDWNKNETFDYQVCTFCETFNHVGFISDALNGFCMQETSFPVVYVVIDDASTDGTQEKIRKFLQDRFPNDVQSESTPDYTLLIANHRVITIVVYLLNENHYSKRKSKGPYVNQWFERSKYRALCEGDDWWTDKNKLQKQFDYLENHPDVTLCFHTAKVHWEDGRKPDALFSNIEDRYYYYDEVFSAFIVPTASIMHRMWILDTSLYKEVFTNPKLIVGDWPLLLVCATLGKIRGMSDCMSVYRRALTGFTLSIGCQTISYNMKAADMNYELFKIFPRPYCNPCRNKTIKYLFGVYSASKGTGQPRYDAIWKSFRLFPIHSLLFVMKYFWNRVTGKPLY